MSVQYALRLAGLCNGSTADSDSVCEGSNPSPAAKTIARPVGLAFVFCMHRRIRTLTLSSPSGCRVSGERVGTSRFASNGGTPFESFSRCPKALSFGWELIYEFGRRDLNPRALFIFPSGISTRLIYPVRSIKSWTKGRYYIIIGKTKFDRR